MNRLLQFRRELILLWHAFWTPETPLYLKGLMLLVPLYLLSPVDFIPDVIPVLGWIDDIIVIPLLVSWIVSMLPQAAPVRPAQKPRSKNGQVIDGDYRRL